MGNRILVIVIVVLLSLGPLTQSFGSNGQDQGRGSDRSSDPVVWYDPLDDLSHVYTPDGLVDVEVTGGEARLASGEDIGYIVSEVIRAEPGYNYNFVFLDAVVPGNSSIEISILNATKESSVLGYANETVPGFAKKVCTDRSLTSIGSVAFPEIRIQVNLNASGTDRPRFLGWYLYYVPKGEWRDEFLGTSKMDGLWGIDLADGTAQIDPSRRKVSGTPVGHDPYPSLAIGYYDSNINVFSSNEDGSSYGDRTQVPSDTVAYLEYADLNADGHYDLVVGQYYDYGIPAYTDSQIYWGNGSGEWGPTGATDLNTYYVSGVVTADFNGDGEVDILISGSDTTTTRIFLNQGGGSFNYQPDIDFGVISTVPAAGDINADGFADIVMYMAGGARLYYGGPIGPSTVAARTFSNNYMATIADIDGDGFDDLILSSLNGPSYHIFLGGEEGPRTNADYTVKGQGSYCYWPAKAGDFNGDGYIDILGGTYLDSDPDIPYYDIFEGKATGWKTADRHEIISGTWMTPEIADVDLDGFDDLLFDVYNGDFEVWYGGASFPTSAGLSMAKDFDWAYDIAVAVPRGSPVRGGSFLTEEITLPYGNKWDIVDLQADVPRNTTVSISVLDRSKRIIPGYKEISSTNIDLSGLPLNERHIHLKVRIWTELNTTTPVLETLTVKWMDERVWRDEFYGDTKIERIHNLEVAEGRLNKSLLGGDSPQLVFTSIRGNDDYSTVPKVYSDAGGLSYLSKAPYEFITRGTAAADTADINGDGFMDVVFAVKQMGVDSFSTASPFFLGGPLGMDVLPDHTFPTNGATDVVIKDIDGDGYYDVVFAQEQKSAGNYQINSTLFMGSVDGWADDPDLEFVTKGASGVIAVDLNGDDLMDLVFSCYRDSDTSTYSMVFLQEATGFNGSSPDHKLQTKGARAVAAADINDDDLVDLVFANSLSGGFAEVDSYIYWGKAGGGFDAIPLGLPTSGASDVKVADLDGDTDLDFVFANFRDNTPRYEVDSFVYLNGGGGSFSTTPDVQLPTEGATGVAVADLDGSGWLDLVFACQHNDTSYKVPSRIYLGSVSGWSSTPDIEIPTEGASDVLVTKLFKYGAGGYMSVPIQPLEPRETGTFHTLRYNATLGASQSGMLQLVDAVTFEVLAETPIVSGSNEWDVTYLFQIRLHASVRVVAILDGLGTAQPFSLDDLWLNWTKRVWKPPVVRDLDISEDSVLRLHTVELSVEVLDDYDLSEELTVLVQHRINSTDTWDDFLVDSLSYDPDTGTWRTTITPRVDVAVGVYDFRVDVTDRDDQFSNWVEFPGMLEVLNNLPTSPVVHLEPPTPVTTTQLRVEMDTSASDLETTGLQYLYRWYLTGELIANLTSDIVPSYYTAKGQNWSVEVSAWDGDDEGLPAIAWVVIKNAPPSTNIDLPDPDIDEDTTDSDWLDLSVAFKDDDGDTITWSLASESENLTVTIDHDTGMVTLEPKANWNGQVELVFIASDGEETFSQKVMVTVNPVNDLPSITYVDGNVPATDPLVYTIKQGETLVISYDVADVEGDEVQAQVNTTAVTHDEVGRTIIFEAANDAVGTLRFGLRIWDVVSTSEKISLNFVIEIENENDPMEEPSITSPLSGETFKVNKSFSLTGMCDDPDVPFGQILEFVWTSNISGELGRGSSITVAILEPGTHEITLTVSDPDFSKWTMIVLYIEPEEIVGPPDDEDPIDTLESTNWIMIAGLLVALVVIGAVMFIVMGKKRTEAYEERMDAEMVEEEKKESMKRTHAVIKELADEWEGDVAEGKAEAKAKAAGWEAEVEGYEEIETDGLSKSQLTMEARVTEEASSDTQKLFAGGAAAATIQTEDEKEAMRLENQKRQYQNAIGRLPYGIPSKELADMDWVALASVLATGEKKTVEGGKDVTQIEGRWYYSDAKDTGTFLKEQGKKDEPKKEAPMAAPSLTDEEMLRKLEERFVLGEISEETYNRFRKKYERDE